jgi:hypothetical protein
MLHCVPKTWSQESLEIVDQVRFWRCAGIGKHCVSLHCNHAQKIQFSCSKNICAHGSFMTKWIQVNGCVEESLIVS